MKRVLIAAVLLLAMSAARAQKVYFIYIQSDSNTPFFVKMGEKVWNSTASGYLILPKLVDSTYQFTVSKAGQATAESRFSVTIAKKDRGFLLREAGNGFSLFDLQAMTSLQPLAAANISTEPIGKRTDPFTVLLAQAANDPSLLEIRATPAVVVETKKEKETEPETTVSATIKEPETETVKPQQEEPDTLVQETVASTTTTAPVEKERLTSEQKEEAVALTEDTKSQAVNTAPEPAATTPTGDVQVYKRSMVTRRSESSTSEGFGLVFWDETDGITDTIRIVIPSQSIMAQKDENKDEGSEKFLNITNVDSTKEDTTVAAANEKIRVAEKRKQCTNEAGERDFFRLRKNMAAKESDEAMIAEARKAFKRACFSTDQIKNLSALFLTAGSKYQFFDAAYGHVLDQGQYATLQAELHDDYYVNRFKALIAQQ